LVWVTWGRARLYRVIGSTHAAQWIGLADQPREFRQRIVLASCGAARVTAAIMAIVGGKGSILVSISHCDDAPPSGKPPTRC
jgi:hypothetical protein